MRWMVHGGARQASRQDGRQPGTPQHELRVGGSVVQGEGRGGGEVHDASVSASSPSALFFDFAPFTTSGLRSVMQAS